MLYCFCLEILQLKKTESLKTTRLIQFRCCRVPNEKDRVYDETGKSLYQFEMLYNLNILHVLVLQFYLDCDKQPENS